MDRTPTPCPCGCGALLPAHVAERERGVRRDAEEDHGPRMAAAVPAIVLLSGMPGAGKSTVARILARRFDRGVHLDLDLVLHHFVVAGAAPDDPTQIELGLRNGAALAANFHDAGFTVVLDGAVPDRRSLGTLRTALAPRPLTTVVLAPPLAVSQRRDRLRGGKQIAHHFAHLYPLMRAKLADEGTWLDTAGLTPAQTADRVLAILR